MRHPPHPERQCGGGADRHPAIGDAAGHHSGRQHAQGAVAQLARLVGEPHAKGPALTERLQGRQALDAVEKLGAESFEGPLATVAGTLLEVHEDGRREQSHQRKDQHHRRHRDIPEGDEDEDRNRRQDGDRQLRHVLAEKGLQLFDAVDDRQHDPAGAFAGEPGRPKGGDLVIEAAAQGLLHLRRGAVRDHRPVVLDKSAQQHRGGDPHGRDRHAEKPGAVEDVRQQHAEDRKAGDADDRGDEPEQDREGDPPPQPARQFPQTSVEVHRRYSLVRP